MRRNAHKYNSEESRLLFERLREQKVWKQIQRFQEAGTIEDEVLMLHLVSLRAYEWTLHHSGIQKFLKRVLDTFFAIVLVLALSPLMLVVILAIKLESPGEPVFYRQIRVGHNFKLFRIWKLRTLRSLKKGELPGETLPFRKSLVNSRETKLGGMLRRRKIDELPQLLNVIVGEMSLVGPRPFSLEDSVACRTRDLLRFAVKPGMTGLWQALYSNALDGKMKIRLDRHYVKKWTLRLDAWLVWNTLWVVAKGEERHAKHCRYTKDTAFKNAA